MMSVSVGRSTMAVNPSVAFWRVRVRSSGFFAKIVVRSILVKLTCYVEEHRCLGGNIISRLYNGTSTGLIYSTSVTEYNLSPLVISVPRGYISTCNNNTVSVWGTPHAVQSYEKVQGPGGTRQGLP